MRIRGTLERGYVGLFHLVLRTETFNPGLVLRIYILGNSPFPKLTPQSFGVRRLLFWGYEVLARNFDWHFRIPPRKALMMKRARRCTLRGSGAEWGGVGGGRRA